MNDSHPASSLGQSDRPEIEYRAVEPWAVGGLILGIVSSTALIGPLLWLVPAVGIVTNLVALGRLRLEVGRPGRLAALVGLGLSVMFGVAPAAQKLSSYVLLSGQAREVADQFLEYLRAGSPEKAVMLRFAPDQRQPNDDLLWTYFRNDQESREDLLGFVENPTVRTLLALGERAEYRFYKTAAVGSEGTRGLVSYVYTVTYPDDESKGGKQQTGKKPDSEEAGNSQEGGKRTFFMSVTMERNPTQKPGINPWRVADMQGGIDPENAQKRR